MAAEDTLAVDRETLDIADDAGAEGAGVDDAGREERPLWGG